MPMVRFDGVSKSYPGGKEALSKVSFELARGEFAFLTGHSGAGKSTLLESIMNLRNGDQIICSIHCIQKGTSPPSAVQILVVGESSASECRFVTEEKALLKRLHQSFLALGTNVQS